MAFLDNYEPVAERVDKFWKDHPSGRIHTEIVMINETEVVVKASIYTDRDDTRPAAIDFAQETRNSSQINRQNFLENCTTSAIGRSLATLGYQTKINGKPQKPSREDMKAVVRESVTDATDLLSKASVAALSGNLDELRDIYKQAQAAKLSEKDLAAIKDLATSLK